MSYSNNTPSLTHKKQSIKSQNYFKAFDGLDNLLEDLVISTMTINCSFVTDFDLNNISKYTELIKGRIVTVTHGKDQKNVRTIVPIKTKRKKKKTKQSKSFYNSVSLDIMSPIKPAKLKNKGTTSVKIFGNGSVHMAGIISEEHFKDVSKILCEEMCKVKGVLNKHTKKIEDKPFANKRDNLKPELVTNIMIRMINSGFKLGFAIDRMKLYSILLIKNDPNIICTFEPCKHAGVKIQYKYKVNKLETNNIYIFIFEKGSVLITAGKTADQINEAYKYIINVVKDNYHDIIKKDTLSIIEEVNNINQSTNNQQIEKTTENINNNTTKRNTNNDNDEEDDNYEEELEDLDELIAMYM